MNTILLKAYTKVNTKVNTFLNDEKGDIVQTSVIIGILAILSIAVLTMLKTPITNVFNSIKTGLEGAL